MSIDEQYLPVTHKHNNCPICDDVALIQDVPLPRSEWDRLMISLNNMNANLHIMTGKRIEIKEEK